MKIRGKLVRNNGKQVELNPGVYRLPCFSDTTSASFKGFHPADDVYYSTLSS
jgi:hypothetical protein